MRKIGAHCVVMPGKGMCEWAYVEWDNEKVYDVVAFNPQTKGEIAGLEFHGGVLTTYEAAHFLAGQAKAGVGMLPLLEAYYSCHPETTTKLLGIVQGIDYKGMLWTTDTHVLPVR